ncbi:MAG: hypothetical protein IK016_08280 [Lachnospiraceae bacterium]|nr:hypothetical protein [Lachnospiraceae bacterium]
MRRRGCIIILICLILSGCGGKSYSLKDAKTIAEEKLGYEYEEMQPENYYNGQKVGEQQGIHINGYGQGAPFQDMYLLPCTSVGEAKQLYERVFEKMDRTWDETEDSFWGMYYMSDAGTYSFVCRKANMVIEVSRISSDGGGPWLVEESVHYQAIDEYHKDAFEEFVNNELPALW